MAPSECGGIFVVQLIGNTLRVPMTEEEEKMALDGKFNPLVNGISLNMQDQTSEGKRFISRNRAGLICNRYDGADFAEEIDSLYNADEDHLQTFLAKKGIPVAIEGLGSVMQDIVSRIFHGLSEGIHDVDICFTIHEQKPNIKDLTESRIYFGNGELVIDEEATELPIQLDESQIYEFESGYISILCDAYAEVLSRAEVTIDDILNLSRKYQMNFYDQRKTYLSAESIQRSISEVYEDGENQFDILKEDAFGGIRTTYYDEHDNGYRRLLEVLKKISDIQLTKSKLMLIRNLVGNLERLGIVHILVNDKMIKSWVEPYKK